LATNLHDYRIYSLHERHFKSDLEKPIPSNQETRQTQENNRRQASSLPIHRSKQDDLGLQGWGGRACRSCLSCGAGCPACRIADGPSARRVKNDALPCTPRAGFPSSPRRLGSLRNSRQGCLRYQDNTVTDNLQPACCMLGTPGEHTGPTIIEAGAIVGRVPSRGVLSRVQAQYEISGLDAPLGSGLGKFSSIILEAAPTGEFPDLSVKSMSSADPSLKHAHPPPHNRSAASGRRAQSDLPSETLSIGGDST